VRLSSSYYENQLVRWSTKRDTGRVTERQFQDWLAFYRSWGHSLSAGYVPPTLALTVDARCNLRCPTCQLGPYHAGRPQDSMSPETAERIAETYPGAFSSVIVAGGEPLLNPRLEGVLAAFRSPVRHIKLYTNGVLVEERATALKDVGTLNVSVDAWDADSYARARGGSLRQFEAVLRGLRILRDEHLPFQLSFLLERRNVANLARYVAFAGDVGAAAAKFHNLNAFHSAGHRSLFAGDGEVERAFETQLAVRDHPIDIALPVLLDPADADFRSVACVQPWDGVRVGPTGELALCCHTDHDPATGSIFDPAAFDGGALRDLRRRHVDGELGGTMCEYCPQRFFGEEYAFFSTRRREWTRLRSGPTHEVTS
jgi:MoaA/NifB/PqqE/SkfB family radical SAM enzyme